MYCNNTYAIGQLSVFAYIHVCSPVEMLYKDHEEDNNQITAKPNFLLFTEWPREIKDMLSS